MKGRRLFSVLTFAVLALFVQAQTTSVQKGETSEKKHSSRSLFGKLQAGYSFDNMTGTNDLSPISGFDVELGLLKEFRGSGLFLGMDVGFLSTGTKWKCIDSMPFAYEDEGMIKHSAIGFSLTPYAGMRLSLSKNVSLSPFVGIYGGRFIKTIILGEGSAILEVTNVNLYSEEVNGVVRYWEEKETVSKEEYYGGGFLCNEKWDAGISFGLELWLSKSFFLTCHMKKGFGFMNYEKAYKFSPDDTNTPSKNVNFSFDDVPAIPLSPMKLTLGLGFKF